MTNLIRLQFIEGVFYPLDLDSLNTLVDYFHVEKFPEHRFDTLSPKLVKNGYKLAVAGYDPEPVKPITPSLAKMGEDFKPIKNPCSHCYLKGLCDSDECGRKNYRLFT